MMTRPLVIALISSLIGAPAARADRHHKKPTSSKKKVEKAEKADDDTVDDRRRARGDDDDDATAKREAARRAVAQAPGDDAGDDDFEGPEASGAVQVTLDELIEVAVRLSPELARSKTDKDAAHGEAIGIRKGWHVEVEGKYDRTGTGGDVAVEPLQTVSQDTLGATLTAGRKLGSGGAIAIQGGYNRQHKEVAISADLLALLNNPAAQLNLDPAKQKELSDGSIAEDSTGYNAFAKMTFTQPLLKGAGAVAKTEGKKLGLAATESTVKVQLAAEKMMKDVISDYWELAYSAQEVDILAQALAFAQEQDKVSRAEYRAGKIAETEINQIAFEIAQRKEALLNAQNLYEKKSHDLRRKVGLGLDRRDVVMRPAEPFEIGREDWDIKDTLTQAHQLNRGLAVNALERRIAELDLKKADNDRLPGLDLELSGGVNGTGTTPDEALAGAPTANGFTVMASLKFSFDTGPAAKGAYDAAHARYNKVEVQRLEAERELDTAVVQQVHTVQAARTRVSISEEAIRVATINAKAEQGNFLAGKTTAFNVMQRQTDVSNAMKRKARAVADYHIAVAALQALSGTLLPQYDINVRPKLER